MLVSVTFEKLKKMQINDDVSNGSISGYFLVNDKLYCEIHARQQKDQFKPSPAMDPNAFA